MFAIVKITPVPPDILHLERMVGRHNCTDAVNMRVGPEHTQKHVETSIEGFRLKGADFFKQSGQKGNS